MRHGERTVLCSKGGRGLKGVSALMHTAMIWRMESRTVVAAKVGANCSMDETSDAIWAEVTTQSSALLPVLRLMALRAMKTLRRDWEGSTLLMAFTRQSWISGTIASMRWQRKTVECLASLNRGKREANNFTENYYNILQYILPQPFLSTPAFFKESLLPPQPRNIRARLLRFPFLPSNIH